MSELVKKAFYDASEREFTFGAWQDVEPILESNKEWRGESQKGEWRKTATIPNVILMQWLNEEHDKGNVGLKMYSDEFDQLIKRKLADPDWGKLKTFEAQANGFLGFGS